jgi:O-antigen/teichoic acid export membrane protein
MPRAKLVVDSVYYTTGEILPRVIGFFLLPLLTRFLTPAEYGINSYTGTVMLFSFALSTLSLNTFLLRNYYKEDTEEGKQKIIGNIFLLTLLTNGLLSGLELLVFPWALARLKIQVPFHPYFMLAIVNNFLDSLSLVPLVIYRVRRNARLFVLINSAKIILQFGASWFMLSSLHAGLTGVYLAKLFVNIPFSLLFVVIVYRYGVFRPDAAQMRKALKFSLPLLPGVMSYLFLSTFDRIVLEKNLGLTSLGLYSTAATLSLALNIIVQGLYRPFEQKIFEKHGTPEYAEVTDTLYRYFLTCLLTGGFLLGIYSREVFILFTSAKFLPAYPLVPLLVVPVIVSGINGFIGMLLIADHRQIMITRATMISVCVSIPGTLGLIRLMGVYGAIVSSTISFGFVCWYYLRSLRLRHSYFPAWGGLLLLMLALTLGSSQMPVMRVIYSIPLKLVVAGLYFWLCTVIFRVGPKDIR